MLPPVLPFVFHVLAAVLACNKRHNEENKVKDFSPGLCFRLKIRKDQTWQETQIKIENGKLLSI